MTNCGHNWPTDEGQGEGEVGECRHPSRTYQVMNSEVLNGTCMPKLSGDIEIILKKTDEEESPTEKTF